MKRGVQSQTPSESAESVSATYTEVYGDNFASETDPSSLDGYQSDDSVSDATGFRAGGCGGHWEWSAENQDYVQWRGGELLLYRAYQRMGSAKAVASRPHHHASKPRDCTVPCEEYRHQETSNGESKHRRKGSDWAGGVSRIAPCKQEHDQQQLRVAEPPKFAAISKPKKFFCPGRIFQVVWFEPESKETTRVKKSDREYSKACPPYQGEKPLARYRWFVVVRKRRNFSLCLSITIFSPGGCELRVPNESAVLYPAGIDAPSPFPEEGILREPVGIIMENGQQFVSPMARLDCRRLYTLEDGLKVAKVGRVHPDSLGLLEAYYKECVN